MTDPLDAPLEAVAWIESTPAEPVDGDWSSVAQTIVLADGFGEDALRGIEDFSHLEVLDLLQRVDPAESNAARSAIRGGPAS